MILRSALRTLKFSGFNILRNAWLSLITIFILVLTLFSISLLTTLNYVASQAINAVIAKVDVDLFFNEETPETDILRAQAFLERLPEVQSIEYVSQAKALEQFKAAHADDPTIQETLKEVENGQGVLPASLVIRAKHLDDYPQLILAIDRSDFNSAIKTKNFESYKTIVGRLERIIDRMTQAGIIVSLIFGFIAILVVFNTVRITIYTHREEIGIMKLVGATNGFIRAPFVIEGAVYAVFAAALTMAILYPLILVATPQINAFLEGYNFDLLFYFRTFFWQILGIQLLVAIVLSVTSTLVAIGRYLKV